MNEENGNSNLETRLDGILDEYCKNNQLIFPKAPLEDLDKYLNMSRDYIENLSRDSCHSISYILANYALYIQKMLNREQARVTWSNNTIKSLCAKYWGNYSEYLKVDIKIELIAKEDTFIQKVIKIRNNAQVRVDELSNLSRILERMASIIERSSYGKE